MIIKEVKTKGELKKFIQLPWNLYKNDKNWIPPFKFMIADSIKGKGNSMMRDNPKVLFLLEDEGKVIGRICAGVDLKLNTSLKDHEGYITFFECIESKAAAFMLFEAAEKWLKSRGMRYVKGPISPSNGDDYKGLLVMGFDGPPKILNSYNPKYYMDFFEEYGFIKYDDYYAYDMDFAYADKKFTEKMTAYLMKKYNFDVEKVDTSNLDREVDDIKKFVDRSIPKDWVDVLPPSREEIMELAKTLKLIGENDFLLLAKSQGTIVGICIAIPDYNPLFKKMNGRVFPFGIIKFLCGKRNMKCLRVLNLIVAEEFHKKGVPYVMFYTMLKISENKGYTNAEGSTIGESNRMACSTLEKAGGVHYRTYRFYIKEIV